MPNKVMLYDKHGHLLSIDKILPISPSYGAFIGIEYEHQRVEDGFGYTAEHNNDNGSGTKATISFTTPNSDVEIHIVMSIRSNVEAFYTLGEEVTMAVAGSDYAPRNQNRRSFNTTSLISAGSSGGVGYVTLGGTVSDFGTVLETMHFGSGRQGGEGRDIREWILRQNTTYAMEVEAQAATAEVTIEIHYYELVRLDFLSRT